MAEVEVTVEMVEAGRRVLMDAVAGCHPEIVSVAHTLAGYLVDAYRAMRVLEPRPTEEASDYTDEIP